MHEMSLAQSIIEILLEELEKEDQVADKVFLKAGKLQQIVPESLMFYYDIFKVEHAKLKQSTLIIEIEEIEGKCPNCQKEFVMKELFFLCPDCQVAIEITKGSELYIDKIELF